MATGEAIDALPDNWLCILYNNNEESFPCDATALKAVSLGIAAGGMALLFAVYLTNKVSGLVFSFLLRYHAGADAPFVGNLPQIQKRCGESCDKPE